MVVLPGGRGDEQGHVPCSVIVMASVPSAFQQRPEPLDGGGMDTVAGVFVLVVDRGVSHEEMNGIVRLVFVRDEETVLCLDRVADEPQHALAGEVIDNLCDRVAIEARTRYCMYQAVGWVSSKSRASW